MNDHFSFGAVSLGRALDYHGVRRRVPTGPEPALLPEGDKGRPKVCSRGRQLSFVPLQARSSAMNKDTIEGNWKQLKGKVK
ncbi:MAG TPA: hypothetical protein VEP93_06075, partial [Variovorax sp.]|nr:hypothetical protein [Variovorax sp.]